MMTEIRSKCKTFSDTTSVHGLTYLTSSSSWISRVFWTIICCSALGLLLVMLILNTMQYFSYPTAIKITETENGFVPPLISFCNHRHLSLLVLQKLYNIIYSNDDRDLGDLMDRIRCFTDTTGVSTGVQFYYHVLEVLRFWRDHVERDFDNKTAPLYKTVRNYYIPQIKHVMSRETFFTQFSEDVVDQVSPERKEFIISCKNGDSDCNFEKYLKEFYHPYFYKCYTYDPLEDTTLGTPVYQGINNGVTMVFLSGTGMIPNNQELPGFDNSFKHTGGTEGVRVVIHPRGTGPDPLNKGVDVPTGASVVLGVTSYEVERMGKPYGNCTSENAEYRSLRDSLSKGISSEEQAEKHQEENDVYTFSDCKRTCHQKLNWKDCDCLDAELPYPLFVSGKSELFCRFAKFKDHGINITECCMENVEKEECMKVIHEIVDDIICQRKITDEYLEVQEDECQCHAACHETQYETTYSLSNWPGKGPVLRFAQRIIIEYVEENFNRSESEEIKQFVEYFTNRNNPEEILSDFVKVSVYFPNPSVTVTSQIQVYSNVDILCNVGGLMGLCLGMSIITICEFCEFIVTIILSVFESKRQPVTPVQKFSVKDDYKGHF